MKNKSLAPFAFMGPTLLVLFVLSYLPLVYAFILAMSSSELGTGKLSFVGLQNIIALLKEKDFIESFFTTMKFGAVSTLMLVVLGLVLAIIFDSKVKFTSTYLTILFIPWVISPVVTGITWRWLFNVDYGLLNYLFQPFGLKVSNLVTKPSIAFLSISIVELWREIAYSTLLLLAGLQSISREYSESAKIDGCSWWQVIRYVTLPILRPTILVVALLLIIRCMNQTGTILVMTYGGPVRATETMSVYMYKEAFFNFHLTNAASISVVLSIINMIFVFAYFRLNRKSAQ